VISPIKRYGVEDRWPIQADFKLLVRLKHPVLKDDLRKANLLAKMGQWPQHFRGKLFHSEEEIVRFAEVLANKNPDQRKEIRKALSV